MSDKKKVIVTISDSGFLFLHKETKKIYPPLPDILLRHTQPVVFDCGSGHIYVLMGMCPSGARQTEAL